MKSQIWIAAAKTAWKELDRLSTPKTNFNKIAATPVNTMNINARDVKIANQRDEQRFSFESLI